MKKIILVLACAFGALALNAQTEKVVFGKMPKSAQEFVQTYFAKENVQDVELNRDDKSEKYTVSFANGNQVVFDNSGDWTEINMKVGPRQYQGSCVEQLLEIPDRADDAER